MSSGASVTGRLRWLTRSSTLRLTLLLSAVFAIGMAVAIVLALWFGRDAVLRRVDTSLVELAASVSDDDVPNGSSVLIRQLDELGGLPSPFAEIAARGGGTVTLDQEFRRSESWRVMVVQGGQDDDDGDDDDERILIALPLDDSEDALDVLGGALWTTAGVVLVFVLAIGLGVGLLVQRRLARINGTLHQLAIGDLSARTGIVRSSDDLDDLARQLDRTASELERLVAQTRHLSASIAHDLRTPLARLRARLESLPEGAARADALEEAERLSGIFDTIMRVARIEAAHGTDGFEPVDLGTLLDELAEIYSPVVEDHGKRLHVSMSRTETISADRKMLIQAMANLIQNTIVHGGPDITLFADTREIGVADNGAGVDAALFSEITKPMVRLDAARESDGTGLGLALVRAVADRHGADLVLSEEDPHGLRVALKFTQM